jgi:hypothetical protein
VKVLTLFLTNPENRYYLREVCKLTALPVMAVQRELGKLSRVKLVNKETSGNRVYFKVNKDFPIYKELKAIILKTTGLGDELASLLGRAKDIDIAFIYGSYAEGERAPRKRYRSVCGREHRREEPPGYSDERISQTRQTEGKPIMLISLLEQIMNLALIICGTTAWPRARKNRSSVATTTRLWTKWIRS